jgi:hypothetical protein
MKIHIFYYEVLLGQSRTIQISTKKKKPKNEKIPKKELNSFPLIHLEVVNINFGLERLAPL